MLKRDVDVVLNCDAPKSADSKTRENYLRKKQAPKQTLVPKQNSFIGDFKSKFFNLQTLRSIFTYRMNVYKTQHGSSATAPYVSMFFRQYEIPLFDFGCRIKSVHSFSKMSGVRIAVHDGCWFLLMVGEEDLLKKESIDIYTPIWQRDKAKKVLRQFFLDNRKVGCYISPHTVKHNETGKIDTVLSTQTQYVRPDVYNYLDKHFKRMLEDKEWYKANQKRYKETFLLHGEPGTGKTSLYMHFAAKYKLNVFRCTPREFVEEFSWILLYAKDDDRMPLMVLIEDLDACDELVKLEFKKGYGDNAPRREEEFNYSTFINALDGAKPLNNVIVGLSTNYLDRLIPSVTRRGRVDHKIELTPLTSVEIGEFVGGEHSGFIGTFPNNAFSISNIPDMRRCETQADLTELAEWLKEDSKH